MSFAWQWASTFEFSITFSFLYSCGSDWKWCDKTAPSFSISKHNKTSFASCYRKLKGVETLFWGEKSFQKIFSLFMDIKERKYSRLRQRVRFWINFKLTIVYECKEKVCSWLFVTFWEEFSFKKCWRVNVKVFERLKDI